MATVDVDLSLMLVLLLILLVTLLELLVVLLPLKTWDLHFFTSNPCWPFILVICSLSELSVPWSTSSQSEFTVASRGLMVTGSRIWTVWISTGSLLLSLTSFWIAAEPAGQFFTRSTLCNAGKCCRFSCGLWWVLITDWLLFDTGGSQGLET